jgi:signal peptidase I
VKHTDDDAFWLTWCKEELAKGRAVHLPAKGLSMLPSIWPKTILSIEQKSFTDVEVGEVIAFERNLKFVVHRVVKKTVSQGLQVVYTQGDSNWHLDELISEAQYIGAITGEVVAAQFKPIEQPPQIILFLVRLAMSIYRFASRIYSKAKQIFRSTPPYK